MNRMQIPLIKLVWLCLFLVTHKLFAFELIEPQQRALFAEEFVTVTVKVPDKYVRRIDIEINEERSYEIITGTDKNIYCKRIKLDLGRNRIDLRSFTGGDEMKELKTINVYYTSPVIQEYKYPPDEYTQTFFHTDANEALCANCHNMAVNEVPGVAFEDVTESNCYSCHKELAKRAKNHAPAVNWICTSCHNGKTANKNKHDQGKSKFTFEDPIKEKCLSCHEKNKNKWAGKRFDHDPAESGRCNRCHNPHSSPNEYYLRKPVWDLCVGCHADKTSGMHVVNTSFTRQNHPTKDKDDPSRPGKRLSCVSCHNPHASNKRFFLPDNRGNQMICTMCHKK